MTRKEKNAQMVSMVDRWQYSGMSKVDFAKAEGFPVSKLHYWMRSIKEKSDTHNSFIQLNGYGEHQHINIRFPNGVELMLPAQTPIGVIRSLIDY